ncbi:MAG: GntR family transcriptional regulator [Christensenellales bacterium]|jgi:GntR family transcriptional regulator
MIITLELDSDSPIYLQIRNTIVAGIADGRLSPGEELPSVRNLAKELGINLHTVNKAYSVLKQEGFITIVRNKGVKVSETIKEGGSAALTGSVLDQLMLAAAEARAGGISRAEYLKLCAKSYDHYISRRDMT